MKVSHRLIGCALLLAVSAATVAANWELILFGVLELMRSTPPMSVSVRSASVVVDVRDLGEYPTTINRIRLTDVSSERVVWELVADTPTVQIWTFELEPGENSVDATVSPFTGKYRVVTPEANAAFQLVSAREYRVELWGEAQDDDSAMVTFVCP